MAIVSTTQRMPITVNERADGDALSTRHGVDLMHNVNNLKLYVTSVVLIPNNIWDTGGSPAAPGTQVLTIAAGSTNEQYVAKWPMLPFPWGLAQVRWMVRARRSQGAGTINLRLYADTRPYGGSASAASLGSQFSGSQRAGSVTVSSGTFGYGNNTFAPLRVAYSLDDPDPQISLTLTGQPSDATTSCDVMLIAAWAYP